MRYVVFFILCMIGWWWLGKVLVPLKPPLTASISGNQALVIAAGIRGAGYNCPAAKLALAEGERPEGFVIKIWCGPVEGEGVYPGLVFKVTERTDGLYKVEPSR